MLTSSPVAPRPTSASASPRDFRYVPASASTSSALPPAQSRSPLQSPRITASLRRRPSRASLSHPSSPPPGPFKSPSQSKPKQYVGVDAATQYSPMEPFDPTVPLRAADAPAPRKPTATTSSTINPANTLNQSNTQPNTTQPPPEPTLSPAAVINPSLNPLSPSKRRGSESHDRQSQHPSAVIGATQSSSPKRTRPNAGPPKELPLRYDLCRVEDMVVLIANMLGELIETNDSLAMKSGNLTRFHSRTAPGISVLDYLQRLAKHATLTPPLLLSMVFYIDRLCARYPDFTINTLTVHRFLITAATVAGKGLSDSFWNNSFYARVGGVKVAELKLLEVEFLYRMDWRIVPDHAILEAYYKGLVDRCDGYTLPEDTNRTTPRDEDETDTIDDDADIRESPGVNTSAQMKPRAILSGVAAFALASFVSASERTASIYIQAIAASPPAPLPLAEIQYDALIPSSSEILSYEAPELPDGAKLVRVGVYNPSAKEWTSSTSVASVENFSKGYSPTLMLSVDRAGLPVSVALRGVAIDAGQTRDFGPQAMIIVAEAGKQPDLNKPVVLSPDGKQVEPQQKTMLQKYWWIVAIVVVISIVGGGDEKK
ncbi:cyclin-domain-containing protein [Xylariaceae sp. FL1272]|nr:cyclin-domain-containing protein [Xylariaceae sp. FL1272]